MNFTTSDLNGTIVNSYVACPKKAWLQARHIYPSNNNSYLQMGNTFSKLRGTQKRMGNFEVDEVSKGKHIIVREYKKTFSNIEASTFQLLFYMLNIKEELKCRKIEGYIVSEEDSNKKHVLLDGKNEAKVKILIEQVIECVNDRRSPHVLNNKLCQYCAHNLYCL